MKIGDFAVFVLRAAEDCSRVTSQDETPVFSSIESARDFIFQSPGLKARIAKVIKDDEIFKNGLGYESIEDYVYTENQWRAADKYFNLLETA